tara:strand:+ start:416 stop:673 length:258 start_codon:yes stop_codon:yes gene_type:complete
MLYSGGMPRRSANAQRLRAEPVSANDPSGASFALRILIMFGFCGNIFMDEDASDGPVSSNTNAQRICPSDLISGKHFNSQGPAVS